MHWNSVVFQHGQDISASKETLSKTDRSESTRSRLDQEQYLHMPPQGTNKDLYYM